MQEKLSIYKMTDVWNKDTLPFEYRLKHKVPEDVWENPTVLLGKMTYYELDEEDNIVQAVTLEPGEFNFIVNPNTLHRYEPATDDMMVQFKFICETKNYFNKKYDLPVPHQQVIDAVEEYNIQPGKTLDLGAGLGRNALYLSLLEHDVTAVDNNASAIQQIDDISEKELLEINSYEYDINSASIKSDYDFIVSTFTLMFIEEKNVASVVENLKEKTKPGGHHLMTVLLSTENYPAPMDFSYKIPENELQKYYKNWEIKEYKEEIGSVSCESISEEPVQAKFATLLAKKPE